MFICKYCESQRKNARSLVQHEVKCPKNPTRSYVNGMTGKTAWNKGKTAKTDKRIKNYAETLSKKLTSGKKEITGCFGWSSEERSLKAKQQGFGGYNENAGRSKKFRVKDSFGNEVVLQSTYELRCSQILDELGITWVRPKHLKYNGKRYFPDFYLPDVDIYLDPKNAYKAKLDEQKIQAVIDQNKVKVYVLLEHHLTAEYLTMLVSPNGEGLG